MNAVQPFFFNGSEVRTVRDERGEPWFVARDVCGVLEIEKPENTYARLDDDERGTCTVGTLGGPQTMTTVSESGLYALIFTSRKPEAKAFRKWVTGTVLPAIRRTGRFEAVRPASREVSETVKAIPPNLRAQILHSATQAAKMYSGGCGDLYEHFERLCEMVYARPPRLPGEEYGFEDLFEEWARACVEADKSGRVQAKDLFASLRGWCLGRGIETPTPKRFGMWMKDNYKRFCGRVVFYEGIRLAD